jgi:RsiW-degrading membrane proteinase PrsW (M82 family)
VEPFVLKALIAVAPVVICLFVFERLDAFKLVSVGETLVLLGAGATLTVVCYFANGGVLDEFPVGFDRYARYVAPIVEETLKGGLIVALFAFNRLGYLIDAAIAGFAIGAGFAVAENAFYLHEFAKAGLGVWIVRGFGTALMHGGATAILAVLSLFLYAPRLRGEVVRFRLNILLFLPGLVAAILIHMAFNHFPEQPLIAMTVVLAATPLILFALFALGETQAHRWLAEDSQAHAALLAAMRGHAFDTTPAGLALTALGQRLGPALARDLNDYVRLNAELVVAAEADLLAIEAHKATERDPGRREAFGRLHGLERRLGRTVTMAVRQHLRFSRDDLWKMHELEVHTVGRGGSSQKRT